MIIQKTVVGLSSDNKKIYLFIMQNEKHTTAKILLVLSFLGLIYLLNILLYLIELI